MLEKWHTSCAAYLNCNVEYTNQTGCCDEMTHTLTQTHLHIPLCPVDGWLGLEGPCLVQGFTPTVLFH